MTARTLTELLDDIDALEDDEYDPADEDDYPWYDAWSWTADPQGGREAVEPAQPAWVVEAPSYDAPEYAAPLAPAPRIAPRDLLDVTLSVTVADGRTVEWSAAEGWNGDTALVDAAKVIAVLHGNLTATTAVARGLVAVAVDGYVDPLVWIAARL